MAAKEGDYFRIPLRNGNFAVGYVISKGRPTFFMGALGRQFETDKKFDSKLLFDVENFGFFGSFFDSKLKNGDWPIMGSLVSDSSSYPLPISKIKKGNDYILERWDRTVIRKATSKDILYYDNPTNRAPMILENAINSFFGLHERNPKYKKVAAEYVISQAKLIS